MPKKPPRNSFYFFMIDLKEEHRKKGIQYANMTELADAAGPLWRDAPPSVRAKFEQIAKKEKNKFSGPEHKYTSYGVPYAEIDRKQEELKKAVEKERTEIYEMVQSRDLETKCMMDMYLMDVNYYCKVNYNEYLIGEMTVLRFNLKNGYKEYYHELINPGGIPVGYASDVKYGSQEYGLDMPDDSKPPTDVIAMQARIVDYLKQSNANDDKIKFTPVFTLPEKVAPILNFIHQMCMITGEKEELFRVYQLDLLFCVLRNELTPGKPGFPKESLALAQLKRDPFKYTPGLGCQHHERDERDKSVECTLSRVKRWAFTVLDTCCPAAGLAAAAAPGTHMPADFDLASIHIVQEQKKIRQAPSVAQGSNTSIITNYSLPASSTGDSTRVVPKKAPTRHHVNLRLPNTNYSGMICPAPEISATEHPSLPVRGRGRGLSSSFGQLSLDE